MIDKGYGGAKSAAEWVRLAQYINYDGYRVGIRRVNGSWKFVYFVNG